MLDSYKELMADQSFNYLLKKTIQNLNYFKGNKVLPVQSVDYLLADTLPNFDSDREAAFNKMVKEWSTRGFNEQEKCSYIMRFLFTIHCLSTIIKKYDELNVEFPVPSYRFSAHKLAIDSGGTMMLVYKNASVGEIKTATFIFRVDAKELTPLTNVKADLLDTVLDAVAVCGETDDIEGPAWMVESLVSTTMAVRDINGKKLEDILKESLDRLRNN